MMAAVSTAPTTTTTAAPSTLTPPSSPHGNGYHWNSPPLQLDESSYDEPRYSKTQASQNKSVLAPSSTDFLTGDVLVSHKIATPALAYHGLEVARPGRPRGASIGLYEKSTETMAGESNKRAASTEAYGSNPEDVSSKWIHRDKLARIESEELQAAGIILPKGRVQSKPRRDISVDRAGAGVRKGGAIDADGLGESQSRKSSTAASDRRLQDGLTPIWDLRLPEEIEADAYFASPVGTRGISRIPVAKLSPAPIPLEHMERDMPMTRTRDNNPGTEDSIAYPKTRSNSVGTRTGDAGSEPPSVSPQRNLARSTSDLSSKKSSGPNPAVHPRKVSTSAKAGTSAGRPKTRNGNSKDSNSSGTAATRPSTRSGEREYSREFSPGAASKQPEGKPPWMISAYRPDPRLPADQQLLPTVARRLQQEKWEREGKFGNIYDKEFRPLTDEGLPEPPEPSEKLAASPEPTTKTEKQGEWPLGPHETHSPTSGQKGSYSTIPKIQDKPVISPLPSPRRPPSTSRASEAAPRSPPLPQHDDDDKRAGCGCCIVM